MSIRAEILERAAEGRLVRLTQLMPGPPDQRQLFMTPEVRDAVDSLGGDTELARRFGAARALLESFTRGDEFVCRMPPSKSVLAMIALLEKPYDNVWELRIRHPRPGVRIFGRFAGKDLFVATNWGLREDLLDSAAQEDDERAWRDEMVRCATIWKNLLPAYDPFTGTTIHDYVSNARLLV